MLTIFYFSINLIVIKYQNYRLIGISQKKEFVLYYYYYYVIIIILLRKWLNIHKYTDNSDISMAKANIKQLRM